MLRLSSTSLRAGGLGLAQLVAWGTLYYAIALLGEPIAREFGLSAPALYGMFSASLALSGLLAPSAGRMLDRRGGRMVMVASGASGALGFAMLALAPSVPVLAAGLALNGIAMAFGLYDTCFAAVAQIERSSYRSTVTGITLLAGLASSVFWPVTHVLVQSIEWRATCAVFAGLLLACSMLYARLLPGHVAVAPSSHELEADPAVDPATRWSARCISLAFAGAALVAGALSAHLPSLLAALRFAPSSAVGIAASIGALQVAGRLVEFLTSGRIAARWLGLFVFAALVASLLCLIVSGREAWFALPFVLLYGSANGLLTVVKAVVPLELLGTQRAGTILGRFAGPSLMARALAPAIFAVLAASGGSLAALGVTAAVALAALAAFSISAMPAIGGRRSPSGRGAGAHAVSNTFVT